MLFLLAKVESIWVPNPPIDPNTPLCASQFALANRACSLLPYTSVPPPAPPAPPAGPQPGYCRRREHEHEHEHEHGHVHWRERRRPARGMLPVVEEVDNACVCEVLLYLPSFLTRPLHNYSVSSTKTCDVTV
ncbi:hypothetical protein Salat_0504100 [Sesamum alatum]|uniref:Uncharacterized protein n=1 Tax=Sesamum alatum TaxID=300844 RepID=A0AAE2D0P4_9LAMI|nr:hypothetical protein Salat_0504100 [Sesamum alatum]